METFPLFFFLADDLLRLTKKMAFLKTWKNWKLANQKNNIFKNEEKLVNKLVDNYTTRKTAFLKTEKNCKLNYSIQVYRYKNILLENSK